MAWCLRALTTLAVDLGLVVSTPRDGSQQSIIPVSGELIPSSGLHEHEMHT